MAILLVSPNPTEISSTVSIAGSSFANLKTRLKLDGVGADTNIFRPRKDGTFNVGINVSSTPKTQTLVAEQQSGSTWKEVTRTSINVVAPKPKLVYTSSISTGSTLSGNVVWTVNVTAGTATKIDFYIDGILKWTELSAPYQYNGDPSGILNTTTLSNGTHTFTVIGYDSTGAYPAVGGIANVSNLVLPTAPTLTGVAGNSQATLGWG